MRRLRVFFVSSLLSAVGFLPGGRLSVRGRARAERETGMEKILNSSNWPLSASMRRIGRHLKQFRTLIGCLAPLWRDPRKIPSTLTRMSSAWDRGGLLAIKQLLLQLPSEVSFNEVWRRYRKLFTPDVEADIRRE